MGRPATQPRQKRLRIIPDNRIPPAEDLFAERAQAKRVLTGEDYTEARQRVLMARQKFVAEKKPFTLTNAFEIELARTHDPVKALSLLRVISTGRGILEPPHPKGSTEQLTFADHASPLSRRLHDEYFKLAKLYPGIAHSEIYTAVMQQAIVSLLEQIKAEEAQKQQK